MKKTINNFYMRLALNEARKSLKSFDGGPFGACIVRNREVVSVARNTVLRNDATCHAEVNAIRLASRKLGSYDLTGCIIYSTTEPCPMCFSAIHWARIKQIVFGTRVRDAKRIGFNELNISNYMMKRIGKSRLSIYSGCLVDECRELLTLWENNPNTFVY